MLNLIISRSGYGKTRHIHDIIKEKAKNGNNDIILIIPEQVSFETEKEILRHLGPKSAQCVKVMSFTRFCDAYFKTFGGRTKPYIDATGKTAIMETALKNVLPSLSLFAKSSRAPDFCEAMTSLSQKLKRYSVTTEQLCAAADVQSGILKQKLFEASLILSTYEGILNENYLDPLDNLTVVANGLKTNKFFEGKTVFIDAFTGFTLQQLEIIESIICTAADAFITLGFDGVYAQSDFSTFANMAKTARRLKEIASNHGIQISPDVVLSDSHRFKTDELAHLERNIFEPDSLSFDEKCENITLCEAKTIYDEAEYVAAAIHRLVRTKGVRYREIAVISRSASDYNGIVDEALSRYDIPCFVDDRQGVENLALFKLIEYALDAVCFGLNETNVVSLLKTGLFDFTDDEISLFEIYINVWRIRGEDFENEFTQSPDAFFYGYEDECKKLLDTFNKIRLSVVEPLFKLKNSMNGSAAKMTVALYKFVVATGAGKQLAAMAKDYSARGMVRLSETTVRSFDLFIGVLDQLSLSLCDVELEKKRFSELFSAAVKGLDMGSLPQGLDEVAVGSAERMRPKSPRVTFIIGANEGIFPSAKSGAGLFTDDELQRLKDKGITLPFCDVDTAVDEQYLAYCALCSASEQLYISYRTASLKGEASEPSVIVSELLSIFPMLTVKYADDVEIENTDDALKFIATQNGVYARSISEYFERSGGRDYNILKQAADKKMPSLSPQTAKKLYGNIIHSSATQIETFHKCRFFYFCKYGIRAKVIRSMGVDNLERGSIVHYILEKVVFKFTPEQADELSNSELYNEVKEYAVEYLGTALDATAQTSIERYRLHLLFKMVCDLLRRIFDDLKQTEFSVYKGELKIGGDDADIEAYEVKLSSGEKILLCGSIDRADCFTAGDRKYVRIIDYKTGTKSMKLSDVLYGQNLQMLVYMTALVKSTGMIPAGAFYYTASEKIISDADRHDSDEVINKKIISASKMNGLFLDDEESYTALEPEKNGIYTNVNINSNGSLDKRSNCYSLEQFGRIARHIDRLIMKMGETLYSGNIDISPIGTSNSSACAYCDYHSVCGFSSEENVAPGLKNDEVFEILSKEDNAQ